MRIRLLAFCALPLLGASCAADAELPLPEPEQIDHITKAACGGDADAGVPDPPPTDTPTWPATTIDPSCETGFRDWGATSPCQRADEELERP